MQQDSIPETQIVTQQVSKEADISGPLNERLLHKNLKARREAYQELHELFENEKDTRGGSFAEYEKYIGKIIQDKNVLALEAALRCIFVFVNRYQNAKNFVEDIVPVVIDKGITGKTSMEKLSQDILLTLMKNGSTDFVISSLVERFSHKTPKMRLASAKLVYEAVKQLGTKVNIKTVLKALPSLFEDSDGKVRGVASQLAGELYRWSKDVVKNHLSKLRSSQLKELEEIFLKIDQEGIQATDSPKSEQNVESQCNKLDEQEPNEQESNELESNEQPTAEKEPVIDTFDLAEPEEVLSKIPPGFYQDVCHKKWQVKRDAIESLNRIINVPKLQTTGNYSQIITVLNGLVLDKHLPVAKLAVASIGYLANGLRQAFSEYAKSCVQNLLARFKEKNPQIVQPVFSTLDIIDTKATPFTEYIDEVVAAVECKVPQSKINTLEWIEKCLARRKRADISKVIKTCAEMFAAEFSDANPKVRDSAFNAMGRLMWVVGEHEVSAYISKLEKAKLDKIQSYCESLGQPPARDNPKPQRPQSQQRTNTKKRSKIVSESSDTQINEKPPVAKKSKLNNSKPGRPEFETEKTMTNTASSVAKPLTQRRPTTSHKKPSSSKSNSASSKPSKNSKIVESESGEITSTISAELVEQRAQELIPETIRDQIGNKKWQERVSALESLKKCIESELKDKLDENAEILIRWLLSGKKESNINVVTKIYNIISVILEYTSISKYCTHIVIQDIANRINTPKIKDEGKNCLLALCAAVSPQFVFSQLYKCGKETKSPAILAEIVQWMGVAITEFGIKVFNSKDLIEFAKYCLESTNPKVKKNTTETLCIMKKYIGDGLIDFFSDVKPQLLKSIKEEFDKVPSEPAPEPKRKIKTSSSDSVPTGGELPRTDINSQINSKILKKLEHKSWRTRLDAIEEVTQIINSANKRITPEVSTLISALKKRLDSDGHANVIIGALGLVGLIATAVGPAISKYGKIILPSVIVKEAATKPQMRQAATQCLEAWAAEITLTPILRYLPKALGPKGHPDGKRDTLLFVSKYFPSMPNKNPENLEPIIKPLISCLQDTQLETRKLAENLIAQIVSHIGVDQVKKYCDDLKFAFKQTIDSIIEKYAPPSDTSNSSGKIKEVISKDKEKQEKNEKNEMQERRRELTAPDSPPKKKFKSRAQKSGGTTRQPAQKIEQSPLPLLSNNKKDERAKKDRTYRWKFDKESRPELVKLLNEQLVGCVSQEIHASLMSDDFKKQLDALTRIQEHLTVQRKELIESLDVLLKWCSLRIFDSSSTLLVRALKFLQKIFVVLTEEKYQLSDYEASIFLPVLFDKLGYNSNSVRESMRELLVDCRQVYAPRKIFSYLIYALKTTKNTRSLTEILDEIALLLDEYKMSVVNNPSSTFSVIVRGIGGCDSVRAGTLAVLQRGFMILGESLWSFMGNIPPLHKQLIEEKLKHVIPGSKEEPTPQNKLQRTRSQHKTLKYLSQHGIPTTQSIDTTASTDFKEFKLELDFDHKKPTNLDIANIKKTAIPSCLKEESTPRLPERTKSEELFSSAALDLSISQEPSIPYLLSQLNPNDPENSIELLKKLVKLFKNDNRSVVPHLKEIIDKITSQISLAFEPEEAEVRLCKYLLNTMMELFSNRTIAEFVAKDQLQHLIDELLKRLLDEKLPKLEDGQHLLRALNTLMLRILENSTRTHTYTSLLHLLQISYRNNWSKKYTELVVKCLLKLTKALAATINRIDIDILLMDLHEFLTNNPPTQFKGKDDLPLRTVKTILNELVKVKGPAIRAHLSLIPTHKNPLIVSYIELMCKSREQKTSETSKQTQKPNSATEQQEINKSDKDLAAELASIFETISNKETTQSGLYKLYRFKKEHPDFDTTTELSKASKPFQQYIIRQLDKITQYENAKRMEKDRINETSQISTDYQTKSSGDVASGFINRLQEITSTQQSTQYSTITDDTTQRPLSQMDAIRKKIKLEQRKIEQQNVSKSLTVEALRKRLLDVEKTNQVSATTKSVDLESLKQRLRISSYLNKYTQKPIDSHTPSTDAATLKLKLANSLNHDAEKENMFQQPK